MAETTNVVPLGDGRFVVIAGQRRQVAFAIRRGGDTWVFLDGRVFVLSDAIQSGTPGRADDPTALSAPMPATVASVHVTPGQHVASGDLLITLEAMKMELAIRAPRQATVKEIRCEPGELVQPGVPLVELEYGS